MDMNKADYATVIRFGNLDAFFKKMEIEKEKSKILIMGFDNAGKTSIILSMQKGTTILSFFKLTPTKHISYTNL